MRSRLAVAIVAAGVAVSACASGGRPAGGAPPPVDLKGSWVINVENSQNPLARGDVPTGDGRAGRPGGGGGGFGGGGGRGGGGHGGGGRGGGMGGPVGGGFSAETMERMRAVMQTFARENEVEVTEADSVLVIRGLGGRDLRLAIDGRTVKDTVPGLEEAELKAEWKDGQLVVEEKGSGLKIQRTIYRGRESPRLIIVTKLSGRVPRTMEFRRVYDLKREG